MTNVARPNNYRLTGRCHNGDDLVAKAAQLSVFHRNRVRLATIDFHHPAVLVAGQGEGIAKPFQTCSISAEWPRRCGGGRTVTSRAWVLPPATVRGVRGPASP
jgi:hypothetical protein